MLVLAQRDELRVLAWKLALGSWNLACAKFVGRGLLENDNLVEVGQVVCDEGLVVQPEGPEEVGLAGP